MPRFEVRWSPIAVSDLERHRIFILKDSPKASKEVIERIREAVLVLHDNPHIGTEIDADDKRRELYISFGRGSFILRYRIDEKSKYILILRVHHSREERTN